MNEEFLEAGEATQYLAKKWGIKSYSTSAFKMLRARWGIEPAFKSSNGTFWRIKDLDAIPKPDRTKPRGKRTKTVVDAVVEEDDEEGSNRASTSVVFKRSAAWLIAPEPAPVLALAGAC
jgi:hypothetical protein